MTEAQSVPLVIVKVPLKGETFRHYERAAAERRTEVGVLISLIADQGVPTPDRPLRSWRRVTPEMRRRIAELAGLGYGPRAIARDVGCSPASVYNHLPAAGDAS